MTPVSYREYAQVSSCEYTPQPIMVLVIWHYARELMYVLEDSINDALCSAAADFANISALSFCTCDGYTV